MIGRAGSHCAESTDIADGSRCSGNNVIAIGDAIQQDTQIDAAPFTPQNARRNSFQIQPKENTKVNKVQKMERPIVTSFQRGATLPVFTDQYAMLYL